MNDIYILGVGHNTPVYIELAYLNGYRVKGLYHYDEKRVGEILHEVPIIGTHEELLSSDISGKFFTLSMGDNNIRTKLAHQIRLKSGNIPTLIHPTASVSIFATLEEGVTIHANATIQADAIIRKDSVISFNVGVTHNSIIEEGCYIAGQTIVGAYVHVKEKVLIGMGSTIVSGKVLFIGQNSIVGAGAVVVESVEDNTIVKGNPAKIYKVINE